MGQIQIKFIVSDGQAQDYEDVVITVTQPGSGTPTEVSGVLYDANDYAIGITTPVVNAKVSLLGTNCFGMSSTSGNFKISPSGACAQVPSGKQVLDIDTSTVQGMILYAAFREEFTVIANVDNVVNRPFYMTRIDPSSLTQVDPTKTTVVKNLNLGVTITIPPHTAKVGSKAGPDFTGMISISPVPKNLAPAAMPSFMNPGLLITIQPVGVFYANPVPLTSPNIDNLVPGSELDIWSLDAGTGGFKYLGGEK